LRLRLGRFGILSRGRFRDSRLLERIVNHDHLGQVVARKGLSQNVIENRLWFCGLFRRFDNRWPRFGWCVGLRGR
jgi:hypothetical protein